MSIKTTFKSGSSAVITVKLLDEDNNPVVPNEASWTLTNDKGEIINDRENVTIEDLYTEMNIILEGNDLSYSNQYFIISGKYDSNVGSNILFRDWTEIEVDFVPYNKILFGSVYY